MVNVMTVGFKSENETDEFLSIANLREYGLRAVGDRIYLDIYTCDEPSFFESISAFVLKIYAKSSAKMYTDKTYRYLSDIERQMITDAAVSDSFLDNVRPKLADVIKSCIKENGMLDIEGFIKFRLRWLTEVLCRRTDVVAEDAIAKREYDELVEMLRYVLGSSEKKGGIILEFAPRSCRVTDLNGIEIENSNPGHDIAENDYFVGILAKMAPKRIIIRNREHCDKSLMMVIKDVFGKSVIFE